MLCYVRVTKTSKNHFKVCIVMSLSKDKTYNFIKRPHSYQLFEKINQPLRLQYHSLAVFNNHAKVVIEIQHGCQLIPVIDAANLSCDSQELI